MPLPFEVARFDALKQLAAERFGRIEFAEAEVLRLSASTEELSTHEREDRPVVRAAFCGGSPPTRRLQRTLTLAASAWRTPRSPRQSNSDSAV